MIRTKSFEYIALEWIEHSNVVAGVRLMRKAVLETFKNNVFPSIGDKPVDTITPPEVLKILAKN